MRKIFLSSLLFLISLSCAGLSDLLPVDSTKTVLVEPSKPVEGTLQIPLPTLPEELPENAELTIPFPRLGMWWPDTSSQALEDIARYDWVILSQWDQEVLAPIKDINPEILILNSTNACELSFNPAPDADPAENAEILKIPSAWFLTQVGTTLTQDIDPNSTVLAVAETSLWKNNREFKLFIPGDTALIENESVFIQEVDEVNHLLTVQRGYVRPASSHSTGVRIAAHITFWPNSWLLNVSTLAPPIQDTSLTGAATWPEYNAIRAANLVLSDSLWDGILLDRSDPNESWLIENSTARTIDPDQSNRLLEDYAELDSTWNEGLRIYIQSLRAKLGEQKIIYLNWGIPFYTAVNGNNFEGFPNAEGFLFGDTPWVEMVMGPEENGSYFEWVANARQPNLSMIETYEEDGGPQATSDGSYHNPCINPGFTPDYRKMRFGLTTALLNDGFFSYEINTNGHGSLCLLWFDEYDNAGKGRGYLGMPLGAAYRISRDLVPDNLLSSGKDAEWDLWTEESEGYQAVLDKGEQTTPEGDDSTHIIIDQAGGVDWKAGFSYSPVFVNASRDYTLSFWAKAEQTRSITAWVQEDEDPWSSWLYFGSFSLTDEWQKFQISSSSTGNDPQARLIFGLGQQTGDIWLGGIKLQTGSLELWRRDFQEGIVLVNATSSTQVVSLGAMFQKIDGAQDHIVNSGELTDQVSLPSSDGIILLYP